MPATEKPHEGLVRTLAHQVRGKQATNLVGSVHEIVRQMKASSIGSWKTIGREPNPSAREIAYLAERINASRALTGTQRQELVSLLKSMGKTHQGMIVTSHHYEVVHSLIDQLGREQ